MTWTPGANLLIALFVPGRAVGTLSTLALPLPIVNALGAFARRHSGINGLSLVLRTSPFRSAMPQPSGVEGG